MNETPRANRIHIAFFGLRNAGKSTLVNAFTGQNLAIVSETPGTTTDPVSKAMEILPLGPCLVTDTAGLDDVGELGAQRVQKTLDVLATTDIAVWVWGGERVGGESRWTKDGRSCCEKVGGESRWTEDGNSTSQPLNPSTPDLDQIYSIFQNECRVRHVTVLEYRRGDPVAALKEKIAALKLVDDTPGLLDGLVAAGDRVICVCPIDASAPKGRLILPQVQVIRAALDLHATCEVCQPEELASVLEVPSPSDSREALDLKSGISNCGFQIANGRTLIVTDSQAFGAVRAVLAASTSRLSSHVSRPGEGVRQETRDASERRETRDASERLETRDVRLTSFSILFARQKGDLDEYVKGLAALKRLKDGDTVLIAEGCTHHRQCNDIGTVKIPKALAKLSGRKLNFTFASGGDFLETRARDARHETREAARQETRDDLSNNQTIKQSNISLIVQCGGCMLTRREVLRRIGLARAAGIPIVNYGMVLAAASGISVEDDACCLASSTSRLSSHVSRPDKGVRRETRDESP